MRIKVILVSTLLLGSALAVGGTPPATSAPAPTCTFSGDLVLDPGLSGTPSSGTFESAPGEDGRYRCSYRYGPAKTGSAGTRGWYGTVDGDSCAAGGEGEGTLRLGEGGSGAGGDNDFTFTYSPFSEDGVATGEFHSERFNGTLTLTAEDGDCALAPVTRIRLEGEGTLQP